MTYLSEIIAEKSMIDKKISELQEILQYTQTEMLAQELFKLIDQRQNKLININIANNSSSIKVGGTEISIATAIVIRDTIKSKIDVLTALIENRECTLDKVNLQSQRDKHYSEYVILNMGINRNDLQVDVN